MLLRTRGLTVWTIVNIVIAAAFVHLASWSWLEPNLRNENVARSGDAVVFMVAAFPVLLFAVLANVIWLLLAGRERRKHDQPWPFPTFFIIAAIWLSAMVVNGLRMRGF